MRPLCIAALMLALLSCRKADSTAQVSGPPETATYAKELDVHLDHMTKQPSGLYVLDVKEGTGPVVGPGQVAQEVAEGEGVLLMAPLEAVTRDTGGNPKSSFPNSFIIGQERLGTGDFHRAH